jgi:hypothetical protein
MPDTPRAQLVHLETDRRLGHEWDEWDGTPLPRGGDFDTPPSRFLLWSAGAILLGLGVFWLGWWLLRPHLQALHPALPGALARTLAGFGGLTGLWWVLLVASLRTPVPLLPEVLAERGPFLRLMRLTSRLAERFGRRDWIENGAVKVFNALALKRRRSVRSGELLLLVPRCLSREAIDGVLSIAGRYAVPVFVATRGQLARRAIRERRPRAVVAVACERDMVSGLHDVAGKVPVLGLTLRLPSGPCKDTLLDLVKLEEWVKRMVGWTEGQGAR